MTALALLVCVFATYLCVVGLVCALIHSSNIDRSEEG